ncbi:hypothetical protein ATKI12_6400 [Kitasatospora sp. Ki12]
MVLVSSRFAARTAGGLPRRASAGSGAGGAGPSGRVARRGGPAARREIVRRRAGGACHEDLRTRGGVRARGARHRHPSQQVRFQGVELIGCLAVEATDDGAVRMRRSSGFPPGEPGANGDFSSILARTPTAPPGGCAGRPAGWRSPVRRRREPVRVLRPGPGRGGVGRPRGRGGRAARSRLAIHSFGWSAGRRCFGRRDCRGRPRRGQRGRHTVVAEARAATWWPSRMRRPTPPATSTSPSTRPSLSDLVGSAHGVGRPAGRAGGSSSYWVVLG